MQYDPALYDEFAQSLATYAAQHDLFTFRTEEPMSSISEADRSVHRIFNDLNRTVQKATGNVINLKELLPMALGAYGFLFVDRSAAAAQWLNWLQFAFDSYIDLHEEEPIADLSGKLETVGFQILEQQETGLEPGGTTRSARGTA